MTIQESSFRINTILSRECSVLLSALVKQEIDSMTAFQNFKHSSKLKKGICISWLKLLLGYATTKIQYNYEMKTTKTKNTRNTCICWITPRCIKNRFKQVFIYQNCYQMQMFCKLKLHLHNHN